MVLINRHDIIAPEFNYRQHTETLRPSNAFLTCARYWRGWPPSCSPRESIRSAFRGRWSPKGPWTRQGVLPEAAATITANDKKTRRCQNVTSVRAWNRLDAASRVKRVFTYWSIPWYRTSCPTFMAATHEKKHFFRRCNHIRDREDMRNRCWAREKKMCFTLNSSITGLSIKKKNRV